MGNRIQLRVFLCDLSASAFRFKSIISDTGWHGGWKPPPHSDEAPGEQFGFAGIGRLEVGDGDGERVGGVGRRGSGQR